MFAIVFNDLATNLIEHEFYDIIQFIRTTNSDAGSDDKLSFSEPQVA